MASIHFLDVGCADTTVIISNNETVLVDCYDIQTYAYLLPKNRSISAVFITHQHSDHFRGLEYLKQNDYKISRLYYSPYLRKNNDYSVTLEEWHAFNSLLTYFIGQGTITFKPYRQTDFRFPFITIADLKIYMTGPFEDIATCDTRQIHDASLVFTVIFSSFKKCCFTGDASDKLLNKIALTTENFADDFLHASHHGSLNGADLDFVKKANAKTTIISTKEHIYPSVPDEEAIKRYSSFSNIVWRTDLKGSLHIQ